MKKLWSGLSPRDRRIAVLGAVVVAAMLAWALAWTPLIASRDSLRDEAVANAQALAWMRPASAQLAALGGTSATRAEDRRSLLARVDASARESGLGGSLVGVEPQDPHRVRVQFSGADFDVFAAWLEQRAASGIRVEELSVQRASGAGRVDARVALREVSM
jgi:Type II secretory pathway, component PulM